MTLRALSLLGRNYRELGSVGTAELRDGGALALTRGAEPKRYAFVDPNEDGALLVRSEHAALLAVVDGHHGARASETALMRLQERAQDLLVPDPRRFEQRTEECVRALAAEITSLGQSRTCLVLAVLIDDRCHFANFGDSSLFRATEAEAITPRNDFILGPDLTVRVLPPSLWAGHFTRESGERIALVSDGVTNFVSDLTRIQHVLRDAADDVAAARRLAEAAMAGGAGDNAAVAAIGSLTA